MKPFFEKLNSFLGAAERRAEDEETGAVEPCEPSLEHTEDELLHFFDTLRPNPRWWDHYLRTQGVALPDGKWVRLVIKFVLAPGEWCATATPQIVTAITLTEDRESDDLTGIEEEVTRSAHEDRRLGWLLRAEVEKVVCSDPNASDSPRVVLHHEGYGKDVVARYRADSDGQGEYWLPTPDLLEPQDGWEAPRHHLAPVFAGGRDEKYFMALTRNVEGKPDYYWVSRELPFVAVFLLWADEQEEWARDAVRRHNGVWAIVRRDWYEMFAKRMTQWLKLWGLGELMFRLSLDTTATKTERKYYVSVLAKCVFVKDMPPVINGMIP